MFVYILIVYLFTLSLYLNNISSIIVHKKAQLCLQNPYIPLPDIIHHNFFTINVLMPDYFLFMCICITIYNYNNLINIQQNLLSISLCLIIRAFSIGLTIMPTCMSIPKKNNNLYIKNFVSTHDLMFSVQSIFFIIIGNMLNSYFIQIYGPFLLVLARQHYTIDVCVSGLVYYFVYTNLNKIF